MYAALFGGVTLPQDLNDLSGSLGSLSGSISDLSLKTSVVYGAKLGIFNAQVPWVGFELETFTTTPHIQELSVSGSVVAPGAHFRMTTVALNGILRYTGTQVHPYVGAGPAVFFAHASNEQGSFSDTSWGLNALAGIRFFLNQHLSVFTEYKFTHTTVQAEGPTTAGFFRGQGDYDAHHFVGGLSFDF